MSELPDDLHAKIERLCEEGNELQEEGRLGDALSRFREAWGLLPEPKQEWDAGLWILGAIGDVEFLRGEFHAGRVTLMEAMQNFDDARENPFLRLRLGQCMYELGEEADAANWLVGAYALDGEAVFEGEEPKYLAFLRRRIEPRPDA